MLSPSHVQFGDGCQAATDKTTRIGCKHLQLYGDGEKVGKGTTDIYFNYSILFFLLVIPWHQV